MISPQSHKIIINYKIAGIREITYMRDSKRCYL